MNELTPVVILKIINSLPPFAYEPVSETAIERETRLTPVAEAIYWASDIRPAGVSRLAQAAALIALAHHETGLAKYVGDGNCLAGPVGMQCDPDKFTGIPRARGYWQHWKVSCPKLWKTEPGSREELFVGARCTAGKLTGAYYRCASRNPNVWAGAFSGFRSITCDWKPATERANSMNHVRYLLTKALDEN
jgi:hypothetical protein